MTEQEKAKEKLEKVRRIIELKEQQVEKLRELELIFLCESGLWDMELESYMRALSRPVPEERRYCKLRADYLSLAGLENCSRR